MLGKQLFKKMTFRFFTSIFFLDNKNNLTFFGLFLVGETSLNNEEKLYIKLLLLLLLLLSQLNSDSLLPSKPNQRTGST